MQIQLKLTVRLLQHPSYHNTATRRKARPIHSNNIWKLHRFRRHLLLQKRFPIISLSIALLSYLNALISCILLWIQYVVGYFSHTTGGAISMLVYGLINLRLCLIYLRWRKHHSDTYKIRNVYFDWRSISILLFSLCSFIFTIFIQDIFIIVIVQSTTWTVHLLISIVIVLIIVLKKVEEGIGCLRETIVLLLFVVFISCLFPLSTVSETTALLFSIVTSTSPYIITSIPLFFPLYYINKMESNINCDNPLFIFIENKENYHSFFQYLTYCWAIENLLFYQKVSVINQIVFKYKNMINSISSSDDNDVDVPVVKHRNKFEFLKPLYTYYESVIGDAEYNELYPSDELRLKLYKIQQEVYDEFIKDGAVNQINISYAAKQQLTHLFGDNDNVKVLRSFNDFLHLFDDAIMEILRLLSSMYHYRFKAFIVSKSE